MQESLCLAFPLISKIGFHMYILGEIKAKEKGVKPLLLTCVPLGLILSVGMWVVVSLPLSEIFLVFCSFPP